MYFQADPDDLDLHGADIGRNAVEGDSQHHVDAPVDLRAAGHVQPVLGMLTPQVLVHVLGYALVAVVDDDLADRGMLPGAEVDQGAVDLHSRSIDDRRGGERKV